MPLLSQPYAYALLITSVWTSKLIHLYSHLTSLPPLLTILYLPTFLILDLLTLVCARLLFIRSSTNSFFCTGAHILGQLLAIVTWLAASSQIAFYVETSGEITWSAASKFAGDWQGLKLLLSGSGYIIVCAFMIVVIAYMITAPLYNQTAKLIELLLLAIKIVNRHPAGYAPLKSGGEASYIDHSSFSDDEQSIEDVEMLVAGRNYGQRQRLSLFARCLILTPVILLIVLQALRPNGQPYRHMSGTLPFTLLQVLEKPPSDFCLPGLVDAMRPFPLPELLDNSNSVANWSISLSDHKEESRRPSWLHDNGPVPGFDRWIDFANASVRHHYQPSYDPLKLSNAHTELLQPLADAFRKSNATIKHVVLLTLESTRADVFPLTTHSHLYDTIQNSHGSDEPADRESLDRLLADISPNAELLTGLSPSSGFARYRTDDTGEQSSWRQRLATQPSSLNVRGSTTSASVSFKSLLTSHCGTHPVPVDFTEEAVLKPYQPCLPQIFDLFNRNNNAAPESGGTGYANWTSVFAQSITDQFDRQDRLTPNIGFAPQHAFTKANLTDPSSLYWPATEPESHYFGYPETQLKPFLRDTFREVQQSGNRLFLSHFTSQTHHPFDTPEAYGRHEMYMGAGRFGKEPVLNRYLNAIRYVDNWLGEVMDMLDEANMTDETLVVLVGDHGWAFAEDDAKHSSFENPHIANLRVPLTFQHPALPPLQLEANATNLNILPTILDLLLSTKSITGTDAEIAKSLLPEYQGQSLLRPLNTGEGRRELWQPAVLNTGGAIISIGSASSPYRLALPLCKPLEYRFTDVARDPYELDAITAWSMEELVKKIETQRQTDYSAEELETAAQWVQDAVKVARWWGWEGKRLWKYSGGASSICRAGRESDGVGTIKKAHWWET